MSMKQIRLNQVGYEPKAGKRAVVCGATETSYMVRNRSTGEVVLEGTLEGPFENVSAGEQNYVADMSSVTIPGEYVICVGEAEANFTVGEHIYEKLYYQSLRFFYLQRCGCRLPEELAGDYAHEVCHDTPARVFGSDVTMDVKGGWHDAGDYGRYVVPAAVTVATLLLAYDKNRKAMGIRLDIPESGGAMPDLLNEVKYELDWMLRMQDPATGKVYHKVTCASFPDFVMPEFETEELILSPPSVTAGATFAACMAMCAPYYENYNEGFSKTMLQAAQKAYAAIKEMQLPGGFLNPEGIVTGEYGDANDRDERYWAAAALYKATGRREYRDDFEALAEEQLMHGYGWADVGTFGNLAFLSCEHPKNEELAGRIRASIIELADHYLANVQADSYAVGVDTYHWGSNYYCAQVGNHLYDAYELTGEEKYRAAAEEQLHYLLGKNPNGYCYVSGFGTVRPEHPHHRPSGAAGRAMPGMLAGGPCEWLADPDAAAHCTGNPPAKCYIDLLGSYSTNEVTIYWNAAMLYLMAEITE